MTIIVAFVLIAVVTSYIFLWRNHITEKPWITESPRGNQAYQQSESNNRVTKQVALIVFLAIVTSMFCLFISAYFMRMDLGDWQPLQDPALLWFNTAMLVLAGGSIQWAGYASNQRQYQSTKCALLATGLFSGIFIVGQLLAWQQLVDQGFYMTSNAAVAFFYLFTGLHGLHILGGLIVWCHATLKIFSEARLSEVTPTVSLCRIYWHFLLIVWLALFGLLLYT